MLGMLIEKLLVFAEAKLDLSDEDIQYYRNVLLFKFDVDKPYKDVLNVSEIKAMQNAAPLIEELEEAIAASNNEKIKNINVESTIVDILGMLTPIPSVVNRIFYERHKRVPHRATDYLYNLGVANNYIKQSEVSKNIKWSGKFGENTINLAINVAKPEKDNKAIAAVLQEDDDEKYPSCALCLENVGFGGSATVPPRQTLRAVPLKLEDEKWYLQYSPFQYFDRHAIVVSEEHKPMIITPRIFGKLLAFTDLFPHFFIGSNSDLPIVGGSILNHEHFQGGAKVMPLFDAKERVRIKNKKFINVDVSILDWPSSVVKLKSTSKRAIIRTSSLIAEKWLEYENKELDIIPFTEEVRHATITPIVLKERKTYTMYLVLRNNRTNAEHPDGIFHSHKQYHHIKKEGIGIIEHLGTFILPARLVREASELQAAFEAGQSFEDLIKEHEDLKLYAPFYTELLNADKANFEQIYREYVKDVALKILDNSAVFKADEASQKAFIKFIKTL
ncbi:MAG TPA: galactose-1-phosphate uridylyltransferase [Bacilli bacterium]|nr:galactose-1-phosphate uridylyltransferase [Bacilli bacterium]